MVNIISNTLIVKVDGRNVCLVAGSLPTSGSSGCDSCMFLFSDDSWDMPDKSAVFWQDSDRRFEVPLGKGDCCEIPGGALEKDGWLFAGLIGRSGSRIQNTKTLLIPLCDGTRAGEPA